MKFLHIFHLPFLIFVYFQFLINEGKCGYKNGGPTLILNTSPSPNINGNPTELNNTMGNISRVDIENPLAQPRLMDF